MKCIHCGGEVPARSLKCPYCNQDNPEGIAFQEEILKKIERNRLLKPFLMKQKKPEMVQKMLTRVIIITVMANVLLFAIMVGMSVWEDRDTFTEVEKSTKAREFAQEFWGDDSYEYKQFCVGMYEFIEKIEDGEMPDDFFIESMVSGGCRAADNAAKADADSREQMETTLEGFFAGYIGLSGEELDFLHPEEDVYYLPEDTKMEVVAKIKEKLEGRVQ